MRHLTPLTSAVTVALLSLMSALSVLPLAAQESTPAAAPAGTPTPFVSETYVGETSDPETFVAVVIAEPADDSEER
jgi:hypothetical protein